jgi:hypothetical protein
MKEVILTVTPDLHDTALYVYCTSSISNLMDRGIGALLITARVHPL